MRTPSFRPILLLTAILLACGDTDSPSLTGSSASAAGVQASSEQSLESNPLIGPVLQSWTGDLPGIQKRRAIRVLVSYGPTNYFIRAGQTLGFEAELMHRYENIPQPGCQQPGAQDRDGIRTDHLSTGCSRPWSRAGGTSSPPG